MGKADENYGLLKIPDSVIVKEQAIEIGKLKAYIEELEEKLKVKGQMKKGSIEALINNNEQLKKRNKHLTSLLYNKNK